MNNEYTLEQILKLRLAAGAGNAVSYEIVSNNIPISKLPEKLRTKFENISDNEIKKIIDDSNNNGIDIVTLKSDKYPDVLRNISNPPIVLFTKGTLPNFSVLPTITIVGPRKVSEFGAKAAYSLSLRLSKAGFTVVSGAALGADTSALKGALSGEGCPVGVLACGICYDYLPENRSLRNKIAEKGCLISEYPPFASTSKFGFPIRNRIMSALSKATVIVEAGEKSGSLITAKHAIEQGKDVFVIPGNPSDKNYKGSNALLRDGAIPLLDTSDIFNVYLNDYADKIDIKNAFTKNKSENNNKIRKKIISGLSKDAEILYNNIINKHFCVDDLLNTGIPGDRILSALTELEFSELIKPLPGGLYEVL